MIPLPILDPKPFDAAADLELAQRCTHEARARDELVKLFAPAIYRLAFRLLGTQEDAEDVVQEAFISVFSSIHTYRAAAPLKSWLYRVAARRALRHIKGLRRVAALEVIVGGAESLSDPHRSDPQKKLDSRALLKRIYALLDQIPDKQRAVFILHEVEGYSLPEVAALLGISVTAAKKRVWRARKKLERLAYKEPGLTDWFTNKQKSDV